MTLALARHPALVVLPAAAGALAAFLLGTFPPAVALVALGAPILACALVVWPWATLPTAILAGTLASQALGLDRVTPIIAVHVTLAALGLLAVLLRRGLDPAWGPRARTPADWPMIAFAAVLVLGAAYGLAAGNPGDRVVVAAYQLAVVPAYFFLATLTLSTPKRLRAASILFAVVAAAMAVAGLAEEGRHGGIFSALALPPALVAAARTESALVRRVLLAACALFTLDIALASYRAVWLATAVALVLLLVFGKGARLRGTIVAALALGAVVALVVALADLGQFRARAGLVEAAFQESAGYRVSEARIGWEVFLSNPVVGQGLGQVERSMFLPELGVTDVGPVYHLFWLAVLTNAGLVGLSLLLWPVVSALRRARRARRGQAVAFGSVLAGFVAAAFFAGPTDGHWELGLLVALTFLALKFEHAEART